MKKILKDSEGKVVSAVIVSSIPEGYSEITIPEELLDQELRYLEAIEVPEVEAVEAVAEVLEVLEVLAVEAVEAVAEELDGEGVVIIEAVEAVEAIEYVAPVAAVAAVEAVEGIAAHTLVQKKSSADTDRRNEILDALRAVRAPMLDELRYNIDKKEDAGEDSSALRAYRQALKDVPQAYIKVDGDPKVSVDTIDLETFEWPVKP